MDIFLKQFTESDCEEARKKAQEQINHKESEIIIVDPIAFKPTIDPYFDAAGSRRQLKARKTARQLQASTEINKKVEQQTK